MKMKKTICVCCGDSIQIDPPINPYLDESYAACPSCGDRSKGAGIDIARRRGLLESRARRVGLRGQYDRDVTPAFEVIEKRNIFFLEEAAIAGLAPTNEARSIFLMSLLAAGSTASIRSRYLCDASCAKCGTPYRWSDLESTLLNDEPRTLYCPGCGDDRVTFEGFGGSGSVFTVRTGKQLRSRSDWSRANLRAWQDREPNEWSYLLR